VAVYCAFPVCHEDRWDFVVFWPTEARIGNPTIIDPDGCKKNDHGIHILLKSKLNFQVSPQRNFTSAMNEVFDAEEAHKFLHAEAFCYSREDSRYL
jgi:hypothetical protein